ncbi:MAG: AAA domain-containing protein, partial [Corynebacterium flavescens]|uniref:AAA domain-containing protein n=1 Tax=Corynebacterium flavescens TaxID=28028 RepID=UPI00264913BC
KAQAWAQLEEQRQGLISTDIDRIQQQLSFIEDRLRKQSAELAQHRAWNHAVSGDRLSPQSRAVLKSYVQQVRKLGKGTGKYAAMQRAEIRKTLDNCRASIPVWIMPLFRVTEQLAIQENMFDVVIVDEASQSSMSAVFLQYLAPKIVVIGDDKQVSPSDVGVRQDELLSLANQLIPELPFKNSWTSTGRSLFDDANMRYGGQLTLTEHRRCVPEIIGFSNAIAYENNGVPLVPVRQVTADRLSPFRLVHTPQGEMTGTATKRINDAEAHAILDHLKQCLEDPRYEGMTFGIISLLGSAQAARIEQLLLSEIDTAVIEERQIMAGIAPDFQGAERDVIFLSMVASYRGDVRFNAQTRERDVQRYNVAVSRAKEQVWVFHSVQAAELNNHEDMRFRLLDYARNTLAAADAAAQKATETIALPSEGSLTEPFDTTFEQDIYRELSQRHFRILPHYNAMGHVIDLVVEGDKARLAIECDGDSWSTREAFNAQMQAQRELERCGWHFYRIWEEDYRADPTASLERLLSAINAQNIAPQPATTVQTATTAQTPTTTRAATEPSPFSTSAPVTPSAPTAQQSAHAGHAEQAGQAEPSEEWTGKVSREFSYEDDFYADDEFSNNPFAALIEAEAEAGTDSTEYGEAAGYADDDDDDNDDVPEDYPTDSLGGSLSNPFSAQPEQPAQPAPALRKAGLPNPLLVRQSNGEETQQRFPLQPSSARSELSV